MSDAHDIYASWLSFAALTGLVEGTQEYKEQKKEYIAERVLRGFRQHFGDDVDSLEAWRAICRTTGVKKVSRLTSVAKCKKALRSRHCNIIDLVSAANAGLTVETFRTKAELSDYIIETEKYFSREAAKGVPLLEEFLIHV
ncbi:hypothetical protein VNI00_006232 [Paramarasmius palmivorus]|uniref:Uncharacterized protein n=1 Tax=Paramarasmius palmivorus TaxID=297713 RepID=A0AAW0D971_9AGAR